MIDAKIMNQWPSGLKYSPQTGIFYKAKGKGKGPVLSIGATGYRILHYKRQIWKLHRLAFLAMTGKSPERNVPVDHINGIKTDNRWANLRLSSTRDNGANLQLHRDGRLVGAQFLKSKNLWTARIRVNGKRLFLGNFESQELAHEAYMKAKAQLDE